jgi:hypothetical protein
MLEPTAREQPKPHTLQENIMSAIATAAAEYAKVADLDSDIAVIDAAPSPFPYPVPAVVTDAEPEALFIITAYMATSNHPYSVALTAKKLGVDYDEAAARVETVISLLEKM